MADDSISSHVFLIMLIQKRWYVYAWWGSNTLHWYDRPNNIRPLVYQTPVQYHSKNWLANWPIWTFCCSSLPFGSRGIVLYLMFWNVFLYDILLCSICIEYIMCFCCDFRWDLMRYTLLVLITKIDSKGETRRSSKLSGRVPEVVVLLPRFISSCHKIQYHSHDNRCYDPHHKW